MAAGVRASERWLLREALVALDADPTALSQPVRVIVPSRSLRLHVAARIAATRGRAAVGLQIQTLDGLALEIVERAGTLLADPALFPVLVRREAARERALAEGLDALVDGYGPVVAAIDDLLDAGFEAGHAEVLEEHLETQQTGSGSLARARAMVRVAARVGRKLETSGVGHRSRLLVRARELLERDPALLPSRALLVHGFSDATGVQADLIATLLARSGARLVLDQPRDPVANTPPDSEGAWAREAPTAGSRYGAAFRERLLASGEPGDAGATPDGAVCLLRARTRSAEVRAVAERLRALLDAGATPERLAVVARDLAPYRLALRQHLTRLGVPFSGVSESGAATAVRRRLDALLVLALQDEEAGMEPWLAAREGLGETTRADLQQAFHRRGALRLDEVAVFAGGSPDHGLALEARRRLRPAEDGKPVRVARRVLVGEHLVAAGRAAVALLRRLEARPLHAPLGEHVDWLCSLASEDLGWRASTPGRSALFAALYALPRDAELDRAEFSWLVHRALDGAGITTIGGAGGGVQLLSVMEARARSFDQLFVLGMNRGAFPRAISEDALLPDGIRARLREVLPDLPVKRDGFDEERFLFAQLLSAAERITLSWSETNAEGRPQPPSPLLESLERAGRSIERELAAPLHARPDASSPALPGPERALLAGLRDGRAGFERAFESAVGEVGLGREVGLGAAEVTAARLAILDEIEPGHGRRNTLGPYFGFVGPARSPADPRRAPLFVTRLEDVARCPWQTFLSRLLRIGPPPDAAHELPSADDKRLLGNVVHGVLERIARRPAPEEGENPLAREAESADWPDDPTLDGWLEAAAAEQLRDDASALPGYARVLALRARPFVLRARDYEWSDGAPAVISTELQIEASVRDVSGASRPLSFRVDRVDRVDGCLVLTDYKTGKVIAPQKKADARAEHLRREIASGKALQGVLYARSGGPGALGRYLFLTENADPAARSLEVADDAFFGEPFDAAVGTLLEAWDRGSFLPRLRKADRDEETGACRTCPVKDACLRGDSGARLRLERWYESEHARRDPAERAAAAVFGIGTDAG